jgi:D-alanine-D-alanine ligase
MPPPRPLQVAVLYNAVGDAADPDERDVLDQLDAVTGALGSLGHRVESVPCDLDLAALRRRLTADRPELVFNLVEALAGSERLSHLVPALLDDLGLPYSGSPTEAILLTANKLLAKAWLTALALPTPPTAAAWPALPKLLEAGRSAAAPPFIVKSVWSHGSVGLDDGAVVAAGPAAGGDELAERVRAQAARLGGACFAEGYVDGREFNLSVLAGSEGAAGEPGAPQVLPPAEIEFVDYPAGKPRIVGYAAKWHTDSFESEHTVRSFDFAGADAPLLAELARLAAACWEGFGLRGYARVDFRVDRRGKPWILEANANPCLAPDAGFAAALGRAGLTYRDGIERIVADALRGAGDGTAAAAPVGAAEGTP